MINGFDQPQNKVTERRPSIMAKVQEPVAVNLSVNIEIDRLEMEDLTERELNQRCEYYYQELLEEVIQSDSEQPSIPEVILAVITDLTNDQIESDDIDYYYTRVHQAAMNSNSVHSRNSSGQSTTLMPMMENEVQVGLLCLNEKF